MTLKPVGLVSSSPAHVQSYRWWPTSRTSPGVGTTLGNLGVCSGICFGIGQGSIEYRLLGSHLGLGTLGRQSPCACPETSQRWACCFYIMWHARRMHYYHWNQMFAPTVQSHVVPSHNYLATNGVQSPPWTSECCVNWALVATMQRWKLCWQRSDGLVSFCLFLIHY